MNKRTVPLKMVVPDPNDPIDHILWAKAEQWAKGIKEVVGGEHGIGDEAFRDKIWDRPPQYFISPVDDFTNLRIKIVEVPDPYDPEGLPKQERAWLTVHDAKCEQCKQVADQKGWVLDAPEGHPNMVHQCPNCGLITFMVGPDAIG